MTDKNERKKFSDKKDYLGIGEILKTFTSDIKELYCEFFGRSNLESKTEDFKQNSSASLKRPNKSYNHLDDFRDHEVISSSRNIQKNSYLQKNNIFSFYSASFGI